MLKKLRDFAHASGVVKIAIWYGSWAWAWQDGSIAPPRKNLRRSPHSTFHLQVRNSQDTCIMSRLTKKSLGAMTETEQEVSHFELTVQYLARFSHFQGSYFMELLLGG